MVVTTLLRQAGVIQVRSTEELLDVVQLLSGQPVPAGRRLGILGNAGGPGILAADGRSLVVMLQAAFGTESREEWGRRLDEHGVIWAPVQTVSEVIDDPQARANGYFTTLEHPTHGIYETVDSPFRFSRSRVTARGPAPEVGQHTEEVLQEAGFTWDEISKSARSKCPLSVGPERWG